ncbi:cobalt transport protein [Streptococcus pneumoniae]|nr:cobalt transport protein [Streptococcus pneumoniae]VIY18383.1 cobalt transport protein [Streptococcus pneumoniae]VKR15393.1 cobalt transport protein [Streptococcus pneumoniae]VKY07587.1 cobalt transport protein [Streptococcus pneumoniae]VLD69870.1 cobalt transport protein [Streptococcus pneumoniae]
MPTFSSNAPFNPNPISKILVVFITGLTVMHSINIRFELAIVCLIGILLYLNGYKKHFSNGLYCVGYFTPCLILWCYLN